MTVSSPSQFSSAYPTNFKAGALRKYLVRAQVDAISGVLRIDCGAVVGPSLALGFNSFVLPAQTEDFILLKAMTAGLTAQLRRFSVREAR